MSKYIIFLSNFSKNVVIQQHSLILAKIQLAFIGQVLKIIVLCTDFPQKFLANIK